MTARIAFGPFELDPDARPFCGTARPCRSATGRPRCWRCSLAARGKAVAKADLLERAWPGRHRRGGQPHRAGRGAAQSHGADAGRAGLDRDHPAGRLPAAGAGAGSRGGGRGRPAGAGRAALPGDGRRGGRRLLRRRDGGGHHRGARAIPVIHRAFELDVVPLPRPGRPARPGPRSRGSLSPEGQRAAVRRAAADHRRAGGRVTPARISGPRATTAPSPRSSSSRTASPRASPR